MTVRLRDHDAAGPRTLFSFTGVVDAARFRVVLAQVERLARGVPGGGQVEVIASPIGAALLIEAMLGLRALQRRGLVMVH